MIGGVEDIYIKPGSKVLYLGAASGTTVSHVSDIVGPVILYNLILLWNWANIEWYCLCCGVFT